MVMRLSPFNPINQTTPFTYRDNATYLTILRLLGDKTNEIIEALKELDVDTHSDINNAIASLIAQFNTALENIEGEWSNRIDGALDNNVVSFDPTHGQKFNSISKAMSNVYDNVRVYAWFAKQYDEMEMTAEDYDALDLTARMYDLTPTNILNATQP